MLIHIETVLQDDQIGWALPVQLLAVEDTDRNTRTGNDELESVGTGMAAGFTGGTVPGAPVD